ncbi:MAG: sulfite exporter TauE/SafE family protein [Flavobacteriaceae bacterium]
MSTTIIIILLIIGVLAGVLSGLVGVGGGLAMIPLMIILLGYSQHEAQGTSLAVLAVPVTFLAAYNYYSEGYINWKFALIIALGFVVGGYFGSKIAISINQAMLKKIFGVILLIAALKMFFGK